MAGVLTPGSGNDFHYKGVTDSGPPSSGSFTAGDWVEDGAGGIQICTVAGTPGTWFNPSAVALSATSVPIATIDTQTADYTLVLADAYGVVRQNVATANNLTIPPNSAVAFAIGTVVDVSQVGVGTTTLVAGAGVTLNSFGGGLVLPGQYGRARLIKTATDVWAVWVQGEPAATSLWIPAKEFDASRTTANSSTPTYAAVNDQLSGWLLDDTAAEDVVANVWVPSHWATINMDMWVAKIGAGSGNIRPRHAINSFTSTDVPSNSPSSSDTAITMGAQYAITVGTLTSSAAAVNAAKMVSILAGRNGASGADTLAGDVALLGVMLRKAS